MKLIEQLIMCEVLSKVLTCWKVAAACGLRNITLREERHKHNNTALLV